MPYKNPEHKRQWEREHREQRNAQRRTRRSEAKNVFVARKPDPNLGQQTKSAWKVLIGVAVGIGLVLLGSLSGITVPDAGSRGSGPAAF